MIYFSFIEFVSYKEKEDFAWDAVLTKLMQDACFSWSVQRVFKEMISTYPNAKSISNVFTNGDILDVSAKLGL